MAPVLQRKPRGRLENIAQQIIALFPPVVRTSEECVKRWYVLQSKARGETAAHKWDFYQISKEICVVISFISSVMALGRR